VAVLLPKTVPPRVGILITDIEHTDCGGEGDIGPLKLDVFLDAFAALVPVSRR